MITQKALWIAFALLVMVLSACTSLAGAVQPPATNQPATQPATTAPTVVSHGNEIGGYVELVDALRAAGATVEPADEIEQEFFSVKGQKIKVNDSEVQVFEYPDEAARKAESDLISPDGTNIGTSMITWVDQPTFWAKGRLIVLYIGKDPAILNLFNTVLGDPITKH